MRIFALENAYTKGDGENISRAFSKKKMMGITLDQLSKVLYSLFLLYAKLRANELY